MFMLQFYVKVCEALQGAFDLHFSVISVAFFFDIFLFCEFLFCIVLY